MFIKDYKNLRNYIINNKSISSLIQLEYSAFSEATVPICTFVLSNLGYDYMGIYLKLSEFTGGMEIQKEKVLECIDNQVNYKFERNMATFKNIPETPISFWIKNYEIFNYPKIKNTFVSGGRTKSHNNKKYVRKWWEINLNNEWEFYANGGKFKRWYGNHEDVIKWSDESKSFYKSKGGLYNEKFWYKEGICWNLITSSINSFKIKLSNFHYSSASPTIFNKNFNTSLTLLGFLNSNVASFMIKLFNPTLNTTVGNILNMPLKKFNNENKINKIVLDNINIVKNDYNNYETSFEFKIHPFIKISHENNNYKLKDIFKIWQMKKFEEFNKLKHNEEQLNRIFIEEYSLHEEVSPIILDKHVSVRLADYKQDIKTFISYAIGCMFGRYSLNNEGLQDIGEKLDLTKYSKYTPDDDNIIPLLDSEYFEDDIVKRLIDFIKTCFGDKYLEENLNFIAGALDKNNKSPRDIIRDYILNHFFEDHTKIYQNCPIYWQFNNGKQNGFNCLIYIHRYEPSLIARIRTYYLHKTQKAIEQRIINNDNIINNSTSKQEVTRDTKEKAKLQKQLKETQEYDEVLAHIANQNIEIDLDDGVKVNYAKFQNIEIKKEGSKTKKVNLLKKI